jgi:hypothetical protein
MFFIGMVFTVSKSVNLLWSDTIENSIYKVINLINDFKSDLRAYPQNLIWIIPAKGERLTKRLSQFILE